MATVVNSLQPPKAQSGIAVTLCPMVKFLRLVHPTKTARLEPIRVHLSALNVTEISPVQPLKALLPIDVIASGMVIETNPVQFRKA